MRATEEQWITVHLKGGQQILALYDADCFVSTDPKRTRSVPEQSAPLGGRRGTCRRRESGGAAAQRGWHRPDRLSPANRHFAEGVELGMIAAFAGRSSAPTQGARASECQRRSPGERRPHRHRRCSVSRTGCSRTRVGASHRLHHHPHHRRRHRHRRSDPYRACPWRASHAKANEIRRGQALPPPDVTLVDKPDVTHGWQPSKAHGQTAAATTTTTQIEEVTWAATADPSASGAYHPS